MDLAAIMGCDSIRMGKDLAIHTWPIIGGTENYKLS